MKRFLLLSALLLPFATMAQQGGISGRTVSREGRMALGDVVISVNGEQVPVKSGTDGSFRLESLPAGDHTLRFETAEFEPLEIVVRISDGVVRDLREVVLVPEMTRTTVDDALFAAFDTESLDDAQALPTSLSASRDPFNRIAAYKFSEMRFNVRGYDSQYQEVYMNGIPLNDALTGYTPWSLWSGLNDAVRNQEVTTGLTLSEVGLGGLGGVTNILTSPSQMREGLRVSLANGNGMYRFRATATYASGYQDNGWSYLFSASTRQGGNSYVDGVYYNAYGYFVAVEKRIRERHRLMATLLGAPTERGTQQAATDEAYKLVGNNYYNPNWGWQGGIRRNARVRDNHEPLLILGYTFDISDRSRLNVATSLRFGRNGYSALTWQNGPDPRPDYYRYLPSYFAQEGDRSAAALQAVYWQANYLDIRHLDFRGMYDTNYMQHNPQDEATYGPGRRANYMIEERHADQLDWNLAVSFHHLFRNRSRIDGGVVLRRNRTEYYSEVKDLLGGDYWADIDKFAERDFGSDVIAYQNDLDYYYRHGHARAARTGDKNSYDYYAHVLRARAWLAYGFRIGQFEAAVGGEIGYAKLWREGLWRKGLFPENSKGDSRKLDYLTARVKGNFAWRISSAHRIEANVVYMREAPTFQSAFLSPRTRSTTTPGIDVEEIFGVEAVYDLHWGDLRARVSGFYTQIWDQSKVLSYYDDVAATYTNFAMSSIDRRHFGVEAAVEVPIYRTLAFNGAVSWGQYTYDSNPRYLQMQDNSGDVVSEGRVYWKNMRVESTPQLAFSMGLTWRAPKSIYLGADFNWYDRMYLSMSPIYRTDAVITSGMTGEAIAHLRRQERFAAAHTLNASIGKTWYIRRAYTLGVNLEVRNLLNDQSIRTGGYEQTRLRKNRETTVTSYEPFDAKYFYMFGTTYYLNLYFRF